MAARQQVVCSSVVQEEKPLANPPERRGTEHIALRQPLRDVIGQAAPHMMDQQVGIQMSLLVFKCRRFVVQTRRHGKRVTKEALDSGIADARSKQLLAALGTRRERRRCGWRQFFHKDRKP